MPRSRQGWTARSGVDVGRESFSRGDRLLLIVVLAVAGLAVSAVLAGQWYQGASATWCDLSSYFSCSRVRESPYAAVGGVPTAFLGVTGFGILAALALLALRGRDRIGPWPVDRWIVAFGLIGAGLAAGLTAIEIFVIEALCILCLAGFLLDLAILATATLARSRG